MSILTTLFKTEITKAYNQMMSGECEVSEEQAKAIVDILMHRPLSKAMVCDEILHVSQSTFNQWIALGWMPKGRKRKGFKELVWYEDEIRECKKNILG